MANVKLNPILEQIRGQVGDLVFKRYGDGVILSRKYDPSEREPTEAQLAHRERFRQAALYGRMVMADPETRTLYERAAVAKGKPIFSLTVADFFNAPEIREVDLSTYTGAVGDPIYISALDDFEVADVQVVVTDVDGNEIEQGAAVKGPDGRWHYAATAPVETGTTVQIRVTANDRPGGSGEASTEKAF